MSNTALHWAWVQTMEDALAKFVLINLADHADYDHSCFPKVMTIADETGLSERCIRDKLTWLEFGGYIVKEARTIAGHGKVGNRYILNLPSQDVVGSRPARGAARGGADRHVVQGRPASTCRSI